MGVLDKLSNLWPTEQKNETHFYVTLSVNGEKFRASGPVLLDSFNELTKNGLIPKSKAILTAERGDKKIEKVLFVIALKRFLINPMSRHIIAKYMELALA